MILFFNHFKMDLFKFPGFSEAEFVIAQTSIVVNGNHNKYFLHSHLLVCMTKRVTFTSMHLAHAFCQICCYSLSHSVRNPQSSI